MARDQRYSDERLAEHLALGQTVAAAARAAGMSERSAYRRKKQPAVRDRIAEVRRAALDAASARLDHGMVTACDRLIGLLGHANPHVQIRAAQTVVQLALKVRREVDGADQLGAVAEPTRPSPVGPVAPDTGAPPARLDPVQDLPDRADCPRSPDSPAPDGTAGPPAGAAPSPTGIDLAAGGNDPGAGAGLDPPPAPTPSGGIPGLDRRPRPDRTAQLVAVVGVLLLLTGLPVAFAGATRARVEGGPAADRGLPTCQNLTGSATAAAAGLNSSPRVPAPTATATASGIGATDPAGKTLPGPVAASFPRAEPAGLGFPSGTGVSPVGRTSDRGALAGNGPAGRRSH